jgi:hypothetical protein
MTPKGVDLGEDEEMDRMGNLSASRSDMCTLTSHRELAGTCVFLLLRQESAAPDEVGDTTRRATEAK